jgi:patatin-like phospholipase/acyl hydrolase
MFLMANNPLVPHAKEALNRFKMEAASEVGVNLKNGYNGDLTARQAGSIGGQMVKNVCPVRTANYERKKRSVVGHLMTITYEVGLAV